LLLTNGCSLSSAKIPDGPSTENWTKHLGKKLNLKVLNLAEAGKNNFRIIEETTRFLITTDIKVDMVVIQLTDWFRENFFKAEKSFNWVPGELDTQLYSQDCFRSRGHEEFAFTRIGDRSLIYSIITYFTLLNSLQSLCEKKNIPFYIFYGWGFLDNIEDPIISTIDKNRFLFKEFIPQFILMDYLEKKGLYVDKRDVKHPTLASHRYISELLYDLIKYGKQVDSSEFKYNKPFIKYIYDYS
jgi:hypothetical protein